MLEMVMVVVEADSNHTATSRTELAFSIISVTLLALYSVSMVLW